jgi:hypothetical protein
MEAKQSVAMLLTEFQQTRDRNPSLRILMDLIDLLAISPQ